jgi:hypothetical protein
MPRSQDRYYRPATRWKSGNLCRANGRIRKPRKKCQYQCQLGRRVVSCRLSLEEERMTSSKADTPIRFPSPASGGASPFYGVCVSSPGKRVCCFSSLYFYRSACRSDASPASFPNLVISLSRYLVISLSLSLSIVDRSTGDASSLSRAEHSRNPEPHRTLPGVGRNLALPRRF